MQRDWPDEEHSLAATAPSREPRLHGNPVRARPGLRVVRWLAPRPKIDRMRDVSAWRRFWSTTLLGMYLAGSLVPCPVASPVRLPPARAVRATPALTRSAQDQAGVHLAGVHDHGAQTQTRTQTRTRATRAAPPQPAPHHAQRHDGAGHHGHDHGTTSPAPARHESVAAGAHARHSVTSSEGSPAWQARCRCGCDQVPSSEYSSLAWHAPGIRTTSIAAALRGPLVATPGPGWHDRAIEPPTPVPLLV